MTLTTEQRERLDITEVYPIRPLGPAFTVYGQGQIFGIPGPVLLLDTVFGTLLTAVLANGLSLMNVSAYWARVVVGAIVLIAILGDLLHHRGKS